METMDIVRKDTLKIWYCCDCELPIALSERTEAQLREQGERFYCPRGHGQSFGKGLIGRLKEQLEAANARSARMEREKHEALIAAYNAQEAEAKAKNAAKRLEKRVSAGVCPCCQRTFQVLSRHMKTKHPSYAL